MSAPWTEQVPCGHCGRPRTVTCYHRAHAERAARLWCRSCKARNRQRGTFATSPARPAALKYHPDETIVDWVIVDRLISGHLAGAPREASTLAERIAAVAHLTAFGMPAMEIAERMHVSSRTVVRLRAAIRQEVAA